MDETPREPVIVWQFLRRHFMRIVVAVVLVAAAYGVVSVYATYHREQRIARKIESHGGHVEIDYVGPDGIPQSVGVRLPFLKRIYAVHLSEQAASVELLSELGSLTKLTFLFLNKTQVTDAGLEHLKGLTNLKWLDLHDTQVSDVGLEHLKGMANVAILDLRNSQVTDAGLQHLRGLTSLTYLRLNDTQVTAEGRATLRKTLPNCNIEPNP